ncbi:MAG: M23 family metallopeptidase [Pseudomonadota bacterium]
MTHTPTIGAPLQGEWRFFRPPGHHPNAFDFVQTVDGRMHNASRLRTVAGGIPSPRFHCWGEPVLAPIDGVVLHCAGDWPDHRHNSLLSMVTRWFDATYRFRPDMDRGFPDIRPNAGNYVMIQSDQGYIVFLAHLQCGSLCVAKGDTVTAGQTLGRVGNSGNSTAPHLHLNLFDQMDDPLGAQVLPFVFTEFEIHDKSDGWQWRERSLPAEKTTLRFQTRPG